MWSPGRFRPSILFSLVVLLAACAQPAARPDPGKEASAPAPARAKTLTIGIQRGLPDFSPFTAMSSSTSARAIPPMVSVGLTYTDDLNVVHPLKAKELPSFDKGTWRVFEDGRMETIWYLHPGVFWHDGAPQTPEDYLFAFEVSQDRDLPGSPSAADLAKSGVSFPDPHTMVISWSRPFVDVATAGQDALPRHRLEEAYRQDKLAAYINHSHWTHEYIADGPYRIVRWDLGGDMELERFVQYFQGRPNFDRVFVRVIGDAQTLIANILSGAVDIVVPPGIDLDAALEVRRYWEGTRNVVRADVVGRIIHLEPQFRPEIARPRFGLTEQSVRQALYQAVNRQQLAEFMTHGFGPLADSYYRPEEPRRSELAIPQFRYDPAAAPALLAAAGWDGRGPDGVLVHNQTGERLSLEIWANVAAGWDKLAYALGEDWRPLGVETRVFPIPPARTGDREFEAGHTSAFVTNVNEDQFWTNRLHSARIPSATTRWVGNNRGGYTNSQLDVLYDRLVATIDPRARTPIEREIVAITVGGLVMMPFYWETLPVLKLAGVKDHKMKTGTNTWFFYDWDKE